MPVEFKQDVIVLSVQNQLQTIPNDFVWIFAGGKPPYDFLNKIGVGLGMRDMTLEASQESTQTRLPRIHTAQGMRAKEAHA
jgi:thioredoxin reductase